MKPSSGKKGGPHWPYIDLETGPSQGSIACSEGGVASPEICFFTPTRAGCGARLHGQEGEKGAPHRCGTHQGPPKSKKSYQPVPCKQKELVLKRAEKTDILGGS